MSQAEVALSFSEAKTKALRYLSQREHSLLELRRKLLIKGVQEIDIESLLLELKEQGWQSDSRFAESYVRFRRERGMGPLKIAIELKARGISEQLIEQMVYQAGINWQEALAQVWRKKYSAPPESIEERSQQARFLMQRGFPADMIQACFSTL